MSSLRELDSNRETQPDSYEEESVRAMSMRFRRLLSEIRPRLLIDG
jgi:hypothetical protein